MAESFNDKAAFDKCLAEAAASKKITVVDFTASWCPYSQRIEPKFKAFAKDYKNINFRLCDVESSCANGANVSAMPTFKFYKDGKEIAEDTLEGADDKELKKLLEKHSK